jgi:hypothetical protein
MLFRFYSENKYFGDGVKLKINTYTYMYGRGVFTSVEPSGVDYWYA